MDNLSNWLVGGGIFTILVSVLKNNWDIHNKIDTMKKERDDKIGRIYGRFDEYKANFEGKHVSKDMCEVLHTQIRNDLTEVKSDVKQLLRKNGIKGDKGDKGDKGTSG